LEVVTKGMVAKGKGSAKEQSDLQVQGARRRNARRAAEAKSAGTQYRHRDPSARKLLEEDGGPRRRTWDMGREAQWRVGEDRLLHDARRLLAAPRLHGLAQKRH
jgi:hypothetical protein